MKFLNWIELAEQNREVDFFFNQNKYSISVNQYGKWYLTKYGDYDNAQEFNSFLELINKSYIDEIPFNDICEQVEVYAIY